MHKISVELTHPQYRADIDGLRAIAIISVVVFHAFRDCFKSGFIGVDIFFVISGFLISTILFSSLESNRFSIAEFYIKRIRRIFPALITVMLATIAFAWFLLFSDEFERFGKHLTAGISFVSNFVFWRESGYFDSSSEAKPLLHFWSLAIEEQFYLFWPLLLAFMWKKGLGFLKIALFIATASFILNIVILKNHPVASFFLPITRIWELMIGGILAYIQLHRPILIEQNKNLQSIAGLIFLLIGYFFIREGDDFPGWWALLPTCGTFLIISAGQTAWINQKLLSNKFMIWVGNISYPLYLWHWPLLSYAYIIQDGAITTLQLVGILCLTVTLSWATYRFIEKPFRFGKLKSQSTPILSLAMLLILTISLLIQFGKVSPRIDNQKLSIFLEARNDIIKFDENFVKYQFNQEKFFRSKSSKSAITAVIGDSHALQYLPRIEYLLNQQPGNLDKIYLAIHEGCLPVPGAPQTASSLIENSCANYRNSIIEFLNDSNVKTIILAACWNCYLIQSENQSNHQLQSGSYSQGQFKAETMKALKDFLGNQINNKNVYLLLDNPSGEAYDPSNYLHGSRLSGFAVSQMKVVNNIANEQLKLRSELLAIAKEVNVKIIDPVDYLCHYSHCLNLDINGLPIYKDTDHLRASFIVKNASYIDVAILKK